MSAASMEDAVLELRKRYWANGYRPIEIWSPDQQVNDKGEPLNSPGKQPRGRWREDAAKDPPGAVTRRPDRRALNTGLLSDEAVGFDVDILDPTLSERIAEIVVSICGGTPLVRVGLAPKTLLVYRAERPFGKIQTPKLILPNGQTPKVEVLAKGQQFVADGVHPVTHQPYEWIDESPETVHISSLPVVTEDQVREVVRRAEQLLREAGAVGDKAEPNGHDRTGSSFFERVNDAALAGAGALVRSLFPTATFAPGTGAWRVSSEDLGRNLEEDISVHPGGIRDFGEEIPLSPIDLAMRHGGGGSAIEVALWLCDRLSIDPASLGYTPRQGESSAKPKTRIIDPRSWAGQPIPQRQWIVPDWVPCGVVTGLYGPGGYGKSLLALQLMTAAALPRHWLGVPVADAVPSLGVFCEDDEDELHRRQDAINTQLYGCDFADLRNMRLMPRLGDDNLLMVFGRKGQGTVTSLFKEVRTAALDLGAKLIIIDTVADTFGGNQNDAGQVRQFVQFGLGQLARDTGGSVLACAHPSVAGINNDTGTSGSVQWDAAFRSRLYLGAPKKDRDDEDPVDPDLRILTRKKANYARRDEAIDLRWVRGTLVTEYEIDDRRPDANTVFLSLLDKMTEEGQNLSSNSRAGNYAPRVFLKRPGRWDYRLRDFEKAMQELFSMGEIRLEPYGRPSNQSMRIVRVSFGLVGA
jgi:RecA-family ATPase